MNQHLINLVLALAAGELVHNLWESQEARKKVRWLSLTIAGKPYKDYVPFHIDTRLKSYAISLLGLIFFTAVFYSFFSWLNLSPKTALWVIATLLFLAYWSIAILLDKYHVEIEQVTKPFRRPKN